MMDDDDVCFDSIVAVDEGCTLIENKTGFDIFIEYFLSFFFLKDYNPSGNPNGVKMGLPKR